MSKITVKELNKACEMLIKSKHENDVILEGNEEDPLSYTSQINLNELCKAVTEIINGHPARYLKVMTELESKKGEENV